MFCLIKLKRNTLSVLAVSDAFKACSEKVLFCTTMYVSLIKSERQSFSVSTLFLKYIWILACGLEVAKWTDIRAARYIACDCHAHLVSKAGSVISNKSPSVHSDRVALLHRAVVLWQATQYPVHYHRRFICDYERELSSLSENTAMCSKCRSIWMQWWRFITYHRTSFTDEIAQTIACNISCSPNDMSCFIFLESIVLNRSDISLRLGVPKP